MGLRFRSSIQVMPGVRINLSKTGISTTIGGAGANINVSRHGTNGTVGLPGTGISWREQIVRRPRASHTRLPRRPIAYPSKVATGFMLIGLAVLMAAVSLVLRYS